MYITIDGCDMTKQTQIISATVFVKSKNINHIARLKDELVNVIQQYYDNNLEVELHSDEEFNLKTNKS